MVNKATIVEDKSSATVQEPLHNKNIRVSKASTTEHSKPVVRAQASVGGATVSRAKVDGKKAGKTS